MAETKIADSRNWLAERLGKPLDRLWLAGVLTVNALVWAAFDAKYIGLALIAYCVVFILALRRRINVAYPAEADKEYRIGYEFNWPHFTQERGRRFIQRYGLLAFFANLLVGGIALLLTGLDAANLPVVSTALVWLTCNGFLLTRYRALFIHCCGRGTLTAHSEKRIQRMLGTRRNGAFAPARLMVVTIVFAIAWSGLLVAYVTGPLGGKHLFGVPPTGIGVLLNAVGVTFVPVLLHLIFFETAITILRGWSENPTSAIDNPPF